ncbi:hypothetical protein [Peijinzhouia sedimentorum]
MNDLKFIISFILNVALALVIAYLFFNLNEEKTERIEEKNENALVVANISNDLLVISRELDEKIENIRRLGGRVETLLEIKEELEEEITNLQENNTINLLKITDLNRRIRTFEATIREKENEINSLQTATRVLSSENVDLKTEKERLEESVSEYEKAQEELKEKAGLAGRLKTQEISLFGVNRRGAESADLRERQIEKLIVRFTIAANYVAIPENKTILVQVQNPENKVVFDINHGSGTFMYEGLEQFYTAKKDIYYDLDEMKIEIELDRMNNLDPGSYTISIFEDDYLLGRQSFIIK